MRLKFLDGTIKIVAEDWPSFLYEQDLYDPNEIDKGLLRGYFLLRVCVFTFRGYGGFIYFFRCFDIFSHHPPRHSRMHQDQMRHVPETRSCIT